MAKAEDWSGIGKETTTFSFPVFFFCPIESTSQQEVRSFRNIRSTPPPGDELWGVGQKRDKLGGYLSNLG